MKKHVKITQKFCDSLPSGIREDMLKLMDELPDDQRVIKRVTRDASPLISAPIVTENEDEERKEAMLYASTRTLDRDAEIILPDGIQLEQYRKNPVLLWGHQWGELPIGSMKNLYSDTYGLRGTAMFADTQQAKDVWQLVKGGHVRTSSIGFIPTEVITRDRNPKEFAQMVTYAKNAWAEFGDDEAAAVRAFITKSILLENSIVPVPANPDATIQSVYGKSLSVSSDILKSMGLQIEETPVKPEPKEPEVKESQKSKKARCVLKVIRRGAAPIKEEPVDMVKAVKDAYEIARGKI